MWTASRGGEALHELLAPRGPRNEGVSIAEVVRRAVDHYAAYKVPASREGAMRSRAGAVVGRYASGHSDTSTDHDRHLAEAFETDGSRR